MLKAIIENKGNTLLVEFPCKRQLLAEHLASIGVTKPAYDIKCIDEDNEPIKVKIYGDSEFEKKLASFISPTDTISLVNTLCELYQNLPYQNKLDTMRAVMNDEVSSLAEVDRHMIEGRMQDTTEYFYCPLLGTLYVRSEDGFIEDDYIEYDGRGLASHEEQIRALIRREDELDDANLAEYFYGSNSAVAKLKEVHFSTQNVAGVLYGRIRAELTSPFTPEEEMEFKDWIEGQCADGYGEGLEQRPIRLDSGDLHISFWQSDNDYFIYNSDEFDQYLSEQKMGGME